MICKQDRDYWRGQPDKRLIEAVLTDGIHNLEICLALAERLDDMPDWSEATQKDVEALERECEDLERQLSEARATIEEQQDEIYKWEQSNGYD